MKSLIEIISPDANVLIGRHDLADLWIASGGIYVWNQQSQMARPSQEMLFEDIKHIIKELSVKIPYLATKEVLVNDESVWKNRYHFDLADFGINYHDQNYLGYGKVKIHLLDELEPEAIDSILQSQKFKGMNFSVQNI